MKPPTRIPRRSPNYARKHRVNEAIKREKAKRRNGVPGKAGIVRLKGEKLEALRRACFERDAWTCRVCGVKIGWGDCEPTPRGEMAHIHAKRNGGDTLENVRTMCRECHAKSHNSNGKPCPKKSLAICNDDSYTAEHETPPM